MKHRIRTLLAAVTALALTALIARTVHPGEPGLTALEYLAAAWLVFAAGAVLLRGVPVRWAVALILIGGAAMQVAAATERPSGSDDLYRYVWDGQVQAAGIDPYEYVPSAPQLDFLRQPDLWPAHRTAWCVAPGTADPDSPGLLTPGCTFINRPTVHTIYPPVAEAYFLTVDVLAPSNSGYKAIQFAAGVLALAVTGAVMLLLRALKRDVRLAALWAWCPLVALEAGNNGHVDVLSSLLTVCALGGLALARTTRGTAGAAILLGLAIATKLTPLFAGPAVLRRRPVLVASAALSAFTVVYIPHVIAVGSKVIGFLPGYLQEQGYDNGSGFTLLSILLPARLTTPAALLILATVAFAVYRRADPDRPWSGALVMTGTALLVTTPPYPWYALLICALVAIDGRAEWLAVAAAAYLSDIAHAEGMAPLAGQRLGYGLGLLVVIVTTLIRRRTPIPLADHAPVHPRDPSTLPLPLPQPLRQSRSL